MIKGMKGGGYLPRNNFSFLDFEENVQIRVLEKKPDLEFDLIGNGGELKLEIPGHGAWYEYSDEDFPDTAASFVNEWSTRQSIWLVFQSSLSKACLFSKLLYKYVFIYGKPFTPTPRLNL